MGTSSVGCTWLLASYLVSNAISYIDTFPLLWISAGMMFLLSFSLGEDHLHKANARALTH
jgi:hypothetical protein